MRRYKLVSKRGEGSFAEVIKAKNIDNGKFYAVKCMKRKFRNIDKVNNLREIKALRRLSPHPNIISLEEVLFDAPTGRLALVFELMHDNLYEAIKDRRSHLGTKIVKSYMHQLYRALDHMHSNGIFHRYVFSLDMMCMTTNFLMLIHNWHRLTTIPSLLSFRPLPLEI